MNFLAHLRLAEPTPASRLGHLLGDFVKGLPWDDRFPDEIWRGILEHRHLDAFTDHHPDWRKSRMRLRQENRRFAGIVIDIFYDHFLSRNWQRLYPDQTLADFAGEVQRDLQSVQHLAPMAIRGTMGRMRSQGWLTSYGTQKGVAAAIERVARISPRLAKIRGLEWELQEHYPAMEEDFLRFYPDAVRKSLALRNPPLRPGPVPAPRDVD